tara:strand:- start:83 stop:952 length:870 start_codon:yes stop_codon:yes gene_type:complete
MKIKILIPVYNDWQSVFKVLNEINNLSIDPKFQISIIIINDASNHDRPNIDENFGNISSLKILNLKKNQGHTRGIATAMKYVYEKDDFDYVIPMDGDGEDRPEEIKNFLNQIDVTNEKAIVGERVKRSEDFLFKSCYLIHKLITFVFTGQSIKFGNYTCLPKSTVKKMIDEKATWNSFSGSLKKVEKNLISIPSIRGARYFGPSQMNFQKLLKHSLCIMSVFRNTFLIRSALFIVLYILLIKSNASIITAVPLIFLLISVYAISNLALRENMDEFDKSLSNINDIVKIK